MSTSNILSQLGSPGVSTGFKNRIINGAMAINQRGGTVTSSSGGTYGIDRFKIYASGGGVFTAVQSSTVPTGAGFVNSSLLTVATADSSIASSDYYAFNQDIEGYNIADLNWGTASAKTVAVSFWVNSSVTGLYVVALTNNDGSRCYPATFTISAASTWQQITLTIPGCTDGTWQTTTNTGITLRLDLGSGSNNNGTANTWNTTGSYAGTRTSSTVNWIATNGATFYITGVQLEVGTTASNFENIDIARLTVQCQRYFQKSDYSANLGSAGATGFTCAKYTTLDSALANIPLICAMRTSPTVTSSGSGCRLVLSSYIGAATITALTSPPAGPITLTIAQNSATTGYGWVDGIGTISISAEL